MNNINSDTPSAARAVLYETEKYKVSTTVIGKTESSVIYLGENILTKSPVAVKTLSKLDAARWEIGCLKKLSFPHVIRYRDHHQRVNVEKNNEPEYSIVMDLLRELDIFRSYFDPGKPLKRLNLSEVKSIASQLFECLANLEEQKLIHHDIKLGNLSWDRAARSLTVFDFGSAKPMGSKSSSSFTYHFAAPEVLLGGEESTSLDIWSAGCALFLLLQGSPIFPSVNKIKNVDDAIHSALMNIVQQLGKPSTEYLKRFQRAPLHFDENNDPKKPSPIPASLPWKDQIRQTLITKGVSEEEIQQWIDLLSSMFCYENRATAKELLKSPLFKDEIKVHLISDPKCKCIIYLQRAAKLSKPLKSTQLEDITDFDLTIDLRRNNNCCLHIPLDPNNQYAIFLRTDNKGIKHLVELKNEGTLDLTELQAKIIQLNEGESVTKRQKPDTL